MSGVVANVAERNARILYRGTEIATYNEPKALAQRGRNRPAAGWRRRAIAVEFLQELCYFDKC